MPSNRILTGATILAGMTLALYYLAPYTVRSLGFSPHVLAVIAGFLLLLPLRLVDIQRDEFIIALVFLGTALLSTLSAPAASSTDILRAWLISMMAFWVFRNTFWRLPQNNLDAGARVLLALWSLAAIGQALIGKAAYVSDWFGASPNVVYSTGLSSFSNHAAILLLPLLVWTLVFNLDQPGWLAQPALVDGLRGALFHFVAGGWAGATGCHASAGAATARPTRANTGLDQVRRSRASGGYSGMGRADPHRPL